MVGRCDVYFRAGKIILAQSVMDNIHVFQMQLERMPNWVHKALDGGTRQCVWGGLNRKRGVHLINWETLIRPKDLGGANLKSAKEMNWALLAKLSWRILTGEEKNLE